jgi:predicted RNase H-like HicB family nuclease
MDLTIEIREEGPGYWSQIRELPGCFASGGTLEELRAGLGEAIGLYLFDRPISLGEQALAVGVARLEVEAPSDSSR